MKDSYRKRVAWALKCKPENVPDDPLELEKELGKRRAELKAKKYPVKPKKVKKVANG